ncbi:palmitoyltransferase akr1 [Phaffia rhodozyma]|uniref:Palmitoyltransferase n=1 Tax=Phaffia rhodozyma TaxID=264483 RepID=A0A0F7SHL3_PHARH|nr:palmitoyltransferase akr1 [Phaffia rhodozyma]
MASVFTAGLVQAKATVSTGEVDDTQLVSKAEQAASIAPGRTSHLETTSSEQQQSHLPSNEEISIHSAAQRGDVQTMDRLVKSGKASVNERDDQNVTSLHWAAINAQLGVCRYLLENGADVDPIGGDLLATPLQWAARNGHLYVLHLLISYGADPALSDSQGFNTLHLVTHSSMVMPLLFILHQPLAVDAKDSDGHTALMWAAYQGDAISVDLLLRHSASPLTKDNNGLSPLHWAVVKGNKVCIKRLVEAGADVDAKDEQGKTPRDMAVELKSIGAWKVGLEEAGREESGILKQKRFSLRTTRIVIFLLPLLFFWLIAGTVSISPWYLGFPLSIAEFYSMHYLITKTVLDYRGFGDSLAKSPYFASIITSSIFYVGQCWVSRIVTGVPGHEILNLLFFVAYILCAYNFYRAISLDPGTTPQLESDAEIKEVVEELTNQGKFNGTNFCIICMARKPLRSKHDRITDRCIARFDHYCPWIWNAVGSNNHRQFLLFVIFLVCGISSFILLSFYYFMENSPTWTPETGAPCVLPSVLCTATGYDSYLALVTFWAMLQLSWTIILLVSQVWQVSRQMTTLEVTNLGRYGFMGGRGGSSLRDQSGAVGVGLGGRTGGPEGLGGPGDLGMGIDPTGVDEPTVSGEETGDGSTLPHVHAHAHGHAHGHRHGILGCMGGGWRFMLQILGLDRFTKGKAAKGLRMAGRDANPFDQGIIGNCMDFWTVGGTLGVDYRQLYDIPLGGFSSQRQRQQSYIQMILPNLGGSTSGESSQRPGYELVRSSEEV